MHRIGIIGCGWVASFHLAALQKFADRASVAWVADTDSARAAAVASHYSVRAISDYRDSLEDADAMIACAERNARTLMVGYLHRYRKSMQMFKDIVTGGSYGKLFMLNALMDESLKGYTTGWISRKETLGGGVFFSSSSHMLHVMLWIGGDVRCASVVGTHGGCDMEGEDTACAVL